MAIACAAKAIGAEVPVRRGHLGDGRDHLVPGPGRHLVPDLRQRPEFRAGDRVGERFAVLDREQRVLVAVQDERRRGDLTQPVGPPVDALGRVGVGGGLDVLGTGVFPGDELARAGFVERHGPRGVGPPRRHRSLDRIGRLLRREVRPQGLRRARQVVRAGARGQQRQRGDPVGVGDADQLGDRAAHRDADQVRPPHPEVIQQRDGVVGQVEQRVVRLTHRVGRRLAGVPHVVADDEASGLGQPLAELRLPEVLRAAGTGQQQHRRPARLAKGVGVDLDAVDVHDHGDPPSWRPYRVTRATTCRTRVRVGATLTSRR